MENLLRDATQLITHHYFQLPICGQENHIYRERVYCYELYHQLRTIWPKDSEYELSGEVDKAGHPLIRGNNLDGVKPDLLIHIPGNMGGNYCAIEVKPMNTRGGIFKDLKTLTAFRTHAGYERAIYLFYGNEITKGIENKILKLNQDHDNSIINLELIELWFHTTIGQPARRIDL